MSLLEYGPSRLCIPNLSASYASRRPVDDLWTWKYEREHCIGHCATYEMESTLTHCGHARRVSRIVGPALPPPVCRRCGSKCPARANHRSVSRKWEASAPDICSEEPNEGRLRDCMGSVQVQSEVRDPLLTLDTNLRCSAHSSARGTAWRRCLSWFGGTTHPCAFSHRPHSGAVGHSM
jgi:ribosomal protein L40E